MVKKKREYGKWLLELYLPARFARLKYALYMHLCINSEEWYLYSVCFMTEYMIGYPNY